MICITCGTQFPAFHGEDFCSMSCENRKAVKNCRCCGVRFTPLDEEDECSTSCEEQEVLRKNTQPKGNCPFGCGRNDAFTNRWGFKECVDCGQRVC